MGDLNKNKSDLYLFCKGIGCALRERCHRYVDGQQIGENTPGYSWMTACPEEERSCFMPMGIK